MTDIFKIFTYDFMQIAFLVGLTTAAVTSYFSVFVVQRNMSFLGSGLAHSSLAGIAIAVLLGIDAFIGSSVYTILCGLMIVLLRTKTKLGLDTLVGVLFSFSMALGAILLSLSPNPSSSAFRYLFGSLLGLGWWDLFYSGLVMFLTVAFLPYWSRWGFSSFDSDLAQSEKAKVLRQDLLLIVFVCLAISVSVKILGMILLAAFLVLPAASARLISRSFSTMTLWSVVFGVMSGFVGLVCSYAYDLPSGASIVLVLSGIFVFCYALSRIKKT